MYKNLLPNIKNFVYLVSLIARQPNSSHKGYTKPFSRGYLLTNASFAYLVNILYTLSA